MKRGVDRAVGDRAGATSAPTGRSPFGIPTPQTAKALIRLYGRHKGEIKKVQTDEQKLIPPHEAEEYIRCIDALMPLLGVPFNPDAVKTVKTRVPISHVDWGDLRATILKLLKDKGEWMDVREIAEGALAPQQKQLDAKVMSAFVQKVREAPFFLAKSGVVVKERQIPPGDGIEVQRYRLSPTLFRI